MSSDKAQRLRESVKWFGVSEELFPKDGLVLTAVSGGSDSMALLSILHALSTELHFRVAVGYFDHQIRKDGAAEYDLVERVARQMTVPFYAGKGDVPALAASSGDTLEEAARKARYRFLNGLADEIGADRLATGHTRTDQTETVLMRILHGTGIRGLAGIPIHRGRIIRPLLCVDRTDTISYCESLALPYIVDPTNEDPGHLRNRIRHELMPLLKTAYHPAVEESLLRLSKNARDMISGIRRTTDPLIARHLRRISDLEWTLNISKIAILDETAIFVLFGDVFGNALSCDMDFSRVHYEQLVRLIRADGASGKMLDLPGVNVKREYEQLVLTKSASRDRSSTFRDYHATLALPGRTKVAGMVVETEVLERSVLDDASVKSTDKVAYFAMDSLRLPLVVRSPETGDRMRPFGMTGQKKLSDIFIDKKIPGRTRSTSLLVADADEILWLVGVTTCEKARVGDQTAKVVRITVREEAQTQVVG